MKFGLFCNILNEIIFACFFQIKENNRFIHKHSDHKFL